MNEPSGCLDELTVECIRERLKVHAIDFVIGRQRFSRLLISLVPPPVPLTDGILSREALQCGHPINSHRAFDGFKSATIAELSSASTQRQRPFPQPLIETPLVARGQDCRKVSAVILRNMFLGFRDPDIEVRFPGYAESVDLAGHKQPVPWGKAVPPEAAVRAKADSWEQAKA